MSQRGTAKTSLTHLPAGEDGAWDPTPRGIFALYIPSPLSIREAVRHVPYARLPPACGHDRRPPSSFFPRASPVPLAAVIPAPVAYIKVVAVKKNLVVGSHSRRVPRFLGTEQAISLPS